jgi:GT2 family glycosyltransferase
MNRIGETFEEKPDLRNRRKFDAREVSIYAVVVLYKTSPANSVTLQTLFRAADEIAGMPIRFAIAIYDNTPEGQEPGVLPVGVCYTATKTNPGLSLVYNTAADIARSEGYEWMLTLDQDTDLPKDFLQAMGRYVKLHQTSSQVGAIVPHIFDHGRHISPLRFIGGFLPKQLLPHFTGVAQQYGSAINSGSLLRLSSLKVIEGYDLRFPLNNSDTSLFSRLDAAGLRIAVAGEILVQHELAIMNRQDRMSIERYRQMLADERAFWDLGMGFMGRVERLIRLVGRTMKDLLEHRNAEFRQLSLAEIRYRLLTRRRNRIERWNQQFS